MPQFTPGNVVVGFARMQGRADRDMAQLMTGLAAAGERQAKINASTGAHPRNTPTPATRYVTGPAVITGNLRRNITHTRAQQIRPHVWRVTVGTARGADYSQYVAELGYRYLEPAAQFVMRVVAPTAVRLRFPR